MATYIKLQTGQSLAFRCFFSLSIDVTLFERASRFFSLLVMNSKKIDSNLDDSFTFFTCWGTRCCLNHSAWWKIDQNIWCCVFDRVYIHQVMKDENWTVLKHSERNNLKISWVVIHQLYIPVGFIYRYVHYLSKIFMKCYTKRIPNVCLKCFCHNHNNENDTSANFQKKVFQYQLPSVIDRKIW